MGVWQAVGDPFAGPAADQEFPGWDSRNALQALVDGLRAGLVGRPVVWGSGESRVAFTLSSLEASIENMAAVSGQADDVRLSAENIDWRSYHFVSVKARLGNVHTRFRPGPTLVAAPIDVSLVMSGEAANALVAQIIPAVSLEITDTGQAILRAARRPHWAYLEVRPAIEHGGVVLRPAAVGRGARLWRFRRRMGSLRPKLTLPDGARITGVEVHPHQLEVHVRVDEWRTGLADLASLVRKSAHRGAGGAGRKRPGS
jgi:hypothetical protein